MYTGKISENEAITQIENKHNHTIKYIEGFVNMHTKCLWKCENCNNEMYVTPSSLKAGHGCSKCAHKKIAKKHLIPLNKIVDRINELYGDSLVLDESTYVNITTKCKFICKKHGERFMKPFSVLQGNGCILCANEANTVPVSKRKEQLKEKFEDRIILDESTYVNSLTKAKFICNIHKEFWAAFKDVIVQKYGCPKCARENNKITIKEMNARLLDRFGDNIQLDESTYRDTYTKARFICKKHDDFWAVPSDVLNETYGCRKCADEASSINQTLSIECISRRLKEMYGDKIIIDQTTYINASSDARFICKEHNYFYAKVYNVLNNASHCPACTKKSLEIPVLNALKLHKITYKHNKALKDCIYDKHPLRPDFYIETKKGILWIECDGLQHQLPVYGENELEKIKVHDVFKNNYCKQKNICLIRIASKIIDGMKNYLLINEFIELLKKGDLGNGELDINIFKPFDFNREV